MMKTKSIKTSFIGSNGNQLAAKLDLPEGEPLGYIVFSHCFTCTKDILTAYRSSRLLAQKGYGVLRFDFSGLGESKGDFSECNFTSTIEDIQGAINYLRENYTAPSILIGHSWGGTSSLATALLEDDIKKVITIASPSQPDHVLHHFQHAITLLEQGTPASFEVAGNFYDIQPQFIEDVRGWNMQEQLKQLDKPVLIFNVKGDALVSEDDSLELEQWIQGETTLINLENTDHLLSDRSANGDVVERMVEWLK